MITREGYYYVVRKYFSFLVEKYDFFEQKTKSQNTLLYDIEYADKDMIISISYEIMGEGVNIVIFKILDGIRSDYDDYENTIHLNRIMKSSQKEEVIKQFKASKPLFEHFGKPESNFETELLKKAELLFSVMRTTFLNK